MNTAQQQIAEDRQRVQSRRGRLSQPHITIEQPRETTALQPMPTPQVPANVPNPRQREVISGTSADKAKAFVIRTRALAIVTGAVIAMIWLLTKWALPLTTGGETKGVLIVGAVSIMFGLIAFFVVWSGAYVIDMAMSPGGIDLFESMRTQKRIDAQSDAMVEAYRKAHGIEIYETKQIEANHER